MISNEFNAAPQQSGGQKLIIPPPAAWRGASPDPEPAILAQLRPGTTLMMGDNPELPPMPERPTLLDFFKYRLTDVTCRHLLTSAKRALDQGQEDKIVLACLLHDIANGCLLRSDHGYWGAQMIAPYVDEEIAWAVQNHQALRYFADPAVGYAYPESYVRFFGADYTPPDYIQQAAKLAKEHRWYMSARLVTLYDIYFFDRWEPIDPEIFTDVVGRHFRQPKEGLGFDGSPTAHMWRTAIWPNNAL